MLTEPATIAHILVLARDLSADDRQVLAQLLRQDEDIPLPEEATLDEAIALYLADACSLGRAAELAGITRWELQERLAAHGMPLVAAGDRPADVIDALADELEREGIV